MEKSRLQTQAAELYKAIQSEKLGEVADEFDRVHSVQRALEVGALHQIIAPATLRPYLIHAVHNAIEKERESRAEAPSTGRVESIESAA